MQKPAGAIFDMDGTLLDSMFYWQQAPCDCLREVYGQEPSPDLMDEIKAMTIAQGGAWIQQKYRLNATGAEVAAAINAMMERFYRTRVQVKPGAADWPHRFRAAGIPVAVATSTDRRLVETALERTGLGAYFSAIFTCTEVGAGKGQPDVYEAALAHLGTPRAQTWVFEDSLFAMETARAAGFPVAGIYDASQAAVQEQVRAVADLYIPRFDRVEPLA